MALCCEYANIEASKQNIQPHKTAPPTRAREIHANTHTHTHTHTKKTQKTQKKKTHTHIHTHKRHTRTYTHKPIIKEYGGIEKNENKEGICLLHKNKDLLKEIKNEKIKNKTINEYGIIGFDTLLYDNPKLYKNNDKYGILQINQEFDGHILQSLQTQSSQSQQSQSQSHNNNNTLQKPATIPKQISIRTWEQHIKKLDNDIIAYRFGFLFCVSMYVYVCMCVYVCMDRDLAIFFVSIVLFLRVCLCLCVYMCVCVYLNDKMVIQ